MYTKQNIKPFIAIGPGHTIKKNLEALGWSQDDLAQIMDISTKQLNMIIKNKARITIETARLLAKAFDTSPEFWVNLDTRYRLNLDRDEKREKSTKRKAIINSVMPVYEILKKGWFSRDKTVDGIEALYHDIWGKKPEDFSEYERCEVLCYTRQKKDDKAYTKNYTFTWQQIARHKSRALKAPVYTRDKLEEIAAHFSEYTSMENGIQRIVRDLHRAGVKFFVLSHLSKTYLDGAAFFEGDNPVIVYTGRYNRVDNFWFTLAHEIAHVLLHLNNDTTQCFVDDLQGDTDKKQENEADKEAERMLKVDAIIEEATPYLNYFTENKLKEISRKLDMEISVILGVLQHKKLVEYRKLTKYKKKISELLPPEIILG